MPKKKHFQQKHIKICIFFTQATNILPDNWSHGPTFFQICLPPSPLLSPYLVRWGPGETWLAAAPIAAGEELTFDYKYCRLICFLNILSSYTFDQK